MLYPVAHDQIQISLPCIARYLVHSTPLLGLQILSIATPLQPCLRAGLPSLHADGHGTAAGDIHAAAGHGSRQSAVRGASGAPPPLPVSPGLAGLTCAEPTDCVPKVEVWCALIDFKQPCSLQQGLVSTMIRGQGVQQGLLLQHGKSCSDGCHACRRCLTCCQATPTTCFPLGSTCTQMARYTTQAPSPPTVPPCASTDHMPHRPPWAKP